MEWKINEVARMTGLTVRTLHYYDQIALLKPDGFTEAGYRIYSEASLKKIQQIMFFRELDFSLGEIKKIIGNPNFDPKQALFRQKELLVKKRRRLDRLIGLIDKTINGDGNMSFNEFDMTELEALKNKYAAEVKKRWGSTDAYAESEKRAGSCGSAQWQVLEGCGSAILQKFGEHKDCPPDSEIAQTLVKRWQDYISDNFYNCTKEILSGLGSMYIGDKRFTKNIDKYGAGTADFMSKAIAVYCGI